MFSVTISDSGVMSTLAGLQARAQTIPESVWRDIGDVIVVSVKQNFMEEGRPSQWPPSRAAIEEGRQTLIKTGRLADSPQITEITSERVEVATGVGLGYARYLQLGTQDHVPTDKQRAFFWAKHREEVGSWKGESMWKRLALAKILRGLPARRFSLFQNEDVTRFTQILRQYLLPSGTERYATTVMN